MSHGFVDVMQFQPTALLHISHSEWHTMYDLAKMFLHCLNHWRLETPTTRRAAHKNEDGSADKVSLEDIENYKVSWNRFHGFEDTAQISCMG